MALFVSPGARLPFGGGRRADRRPASGLYRVLRFFALVGVTIALTSGTCTDVRAGCSFTAGSLIYHVNNSVVRWRPPDGTRTQVVYYWPPLTSDYISASSLGFDAWNGHTNDQVLFIFGGISQTIFNQYGNVVPQDEAARTTRFWFGYPPQMNSYITEVNKFHFPDAVWAVTGGAGKLSLRAVLMHEAGHALGLNHLDPKAGDTSDCPTVMKPTQLGGDWSRLDYFDRSAAHTAYQCPDGVSWGCVKSLYTGPRWYSGVVTAMSGESNTVVWQAQSENADYSIFRWTDEQDPDEAELLTSLSGDTVYVDDDIEAGTEYNYRVASDDGQEQLELGSASAGLKQVAEVTVDDDTYRYATALAVRGSKLFAASADEIVRLDISDPTIPVETGRRVMHEHVMDIALSNNGEKLYVTTETDFVILNAIGGSGLPVAGAIYELAVLDPNTHGGLYDILVDYPIVYVSCGNRGLAAIDVQTNPSSPVVVATYDLDGEDTAFTTEALELVDGDLYVEAHDHPWENWRWERLQVVKTFTQPYWDVAFSLICASNDPNCWEAALPFPARCDGQGKGLFTLGVNSQLLVARKKTPGVLAALGDAVPPYEPPTQYDSNTSAEILSFDVDSRGVYTTVDIASDGLNRSVLTYDPWDGQAGERLVTGSIGQDDVEGGIVRSQGRFLYTLTQKGSDVVVTVFEKPYGCEPDPVRPVRLFPEDDAYNQGDEIVIASAIGCPTSFLVELVEDGEDVDEIASESFTITDDVSYVSRWSVEGESTDLENHTYQIKVTATYEVGPTQTFFSTPFRVEVGNVHEVAIGGGKDFTSIQPAIAAASSGDTVLVYAGDYHEHLTLRSNVHVVGKPGARLVPSTAGVAVVATDLVHPPLFEGIDVAFTNGVTDGGIYVENCGVQVKNCVFTGLERAVEIVNGHGSFFACEFIDNHDASVGGAAWINSSAVGQTVFSQCQFENNSAVSYGGAVWISSEGAYEASAPQVRFVNCIFRENEAPSFATVRIGVNTSPSFERCIFASNEVVGGGAVLGGVGGASAVIRNCTFADNYCASGYDLVSIEPLATGPDVVIDACLFANNPNARAVSNAHGAEYQVSNSDFYENGAGDAASASSGTSNFSADPVFCDVSDYSIQAYSPCIPGITVPSLVGAVDVGCVPQATVMVNPGTFPDTLIVGCPQGDGDSLIVNIDFANYVTRTIGASEIALMTPYSSKGIWSTSPIVASSAATAPDFLTSVRHFNLSGGVLTPQWEVLNDEFTVLLNGRALAQVPSARRRSPDINGNGVVNIIDYAMFAADYTSPPKTLMRRSDFTGDAKVILQDFAIFNEHYNHTKPFSGSGYVATSEIEQSPATVSLRFEAFDPLEGNSRLKATVSLHSAGLFRATLITLKNENPKFRFIEWHAGEEYLQTTMATDLVRDGSKIIVIGALGSKYGDPNEVELGYFDVEVLFDDPLEPLAGDFELVAADVLTMGETIQAVPRTSSLREYAAPVYRDELRQNYPNPFNPTTTIAFSLARASQVELKIFDVRGALVRTLVNDRRQNGNHRVVWTGDNNQGNHVASGVYFYRLRAGQFKATKKMVLIR